METKKGISLYIILILVFTILYLFLAAKPLQKEYQFIPQWKISTLNPVINTNTDKEKIFFHLGQNAGYFTKDGEITYQTTFPFNITISDSNFATYSAEAINLPLYSNDGKEIGKIEPQGFPFFSKDNLYVFLPGGCSLAKCNKDGSLSWSYKGTVPITAFTSTNDFCAVGYADGIIKLFDNTDGNCILEYFPGGSDYPIILGIGISSDGKYIASISGHNKQRFVVTEKVENQPKIIYHSFINKEIFTRVLVSFSKDNQNIYFNYGDRLGIYNLNKNKEYSIETTNQIISLEESNGLIYALDKNQNKYTLYIIENTNTLIGNFSFEADKAFIRAKDEYLYIGKDNHISQLLVTKQ
mgnify:FL=1